MKALSETTKKKDNYSDVVTGKEIKVTYGNLSATFVAFDGQIMEFNYLLN